LLKSISQMYAEEVKSLPLARNGRPDPLETSRLKSELHPRFWRPIADILDPRDRRTEVGAAAHALFSRGQITLDSHEIEQSHGLMKNYLGVSRLRFGTWLRLRPIFQHLLEDALTHDDVDLVACAVREFVRLELGQAPDPEYGRVDVCTTRDVLNDESCCEEDEAWLSMLEAERHYDHFGRRESRMFEWTRAWQTCFDDPAAFGKQFPGMSGRRWNMAHALKPIFDRDWVSDAKLIDDAVRYAKALLAFPFEENRLSSQPSGSLLAEVA
jgi:hypothetical protein